MPITPVAAPIRPAARIRLLHREHKLDAPDIARLTGYPLKQVRAALGRREARDTPKSRAPHVEARGPLTAQEVSDRPDISVERRDARTGCGVRALNPGPNAVLPDSLNGSFWPISLI
jgi:hypothetical protein